jgi:hypothetical protein
LAPIVIVVHARRKGIAMTAKLVAAGALALGLALAALVPAAARADDSRRVMTITGLGEVRAKPDMAQVTIGVVRQAPTARAALDQNSAAMAAILSRLKEEGYAEKDIQTSNFSISPRYDYSKNEQPPKLVAYEVSNQVTVTVRDLTKLGGLLDAAVDLGSNQIFGVAFSLADASGARNEARRLAVGDALAKARLYAEAAGVTLGPIIALSETGDIQPPRPYRAGAMQMTAEAAASVPIAEGEQVIEARVTIEWMIR